MLSFVLNNSVVTDLQKMDKEVKNELVSGKTGGKSIYNVYFSNLKIVG